MEHSFKANKAHWNELVPIHQQSADYNLQGFLAGECSLRSLERGELGNVQGKSLLHLQCHFGMDTLSWARRGARVTGVDFSDAAIEAARSLSERAAVPARFIQANLYDLPDALASPFDIVYTSYGVLAWLPDLPRWAEIIARYLKLDGIFYIAEIHPLLMVFDDETSGLKVRYSYFHAPEPYEWVAEGSYADPKATVRNQTTYQWNHSLGDIVNALIGAGLRVLFLHEFPVCCYQALPQMERGEDGWWRLPDGDERLPLTFSLMARKE
jgi:SAM-dependent methyltransferase